METLPLLHHPFHRKVNVSSLNPCAKFYVFLWREPSLYKFRQLISFLILFSYGVSHLPLDKMVEKAYELILKKRIERVGEEFYNVVGEHGKLTELSAVAAQVTDKKENALIHSLF